MWWPDDRNGHDDRGGRDDHDDHNEAELESAAVAPVAGVFSGLLAAAATFLLL